MNIYICKNCGNLTETEETENIFCSNCGAPLVESKPEEKEAPPQPPATTQPQVVEAPQEQPSPEKSSTEPQQAPTSEPVETKESATPATSAAPRPSAQQREVPLGAARSGPGTPATSAESSPSGTSPQQAPAVAGPSIMEVFEDKNLVVCPQCSYGCKPAWSKCPICGTEIAGATDLQKITEADFKFDEKSLEVKLVPCPKCQYSCDPSWDKCPICQTALEKSE